MRLIFAYAPRTRRRIIGKESLQKVRDALDQAINGSLLRDGLNHDDDELSSIAARSDNAYTKVKLVCHAKRLGEALAILDTALAAEPQPVAWVVRKPAGYHVVGFDTTVINKVPHGTLLYTAHKENSK